MKAAEFNYQKARSIQEVIQLLDQYGDNAKLMAGGQSLLPSLNMRLSNPEILIDLQSVAELKGISQVGQVIRIGAMTTHTEIENSALIQQHLPILTEAVRHIAHRAIRNLGTWGGSCVYGDPAAEWPACAVALNGVMVLQGPKGERRVLAKDFFLDLYTTALETNEILVATEFSLHKAMSKHYFEELSRRHGDYAVTGIVAQVIIDQNVIIESQIVYFSVASTPAMASGVQALIKGKNIHAIATPEIIAQATQLVRSEIATLADLTNTAQMKTHLVGVLLERALKHIANSLRR
jgi:carbon-monoxide dehydrogenase medium subunit